MSGLTYCPIPHRGAVAVSGADRVAFLQGLVSNDVTRVAADRAIWAALLTAQGRFQYDMFILDAGDDTLMLETERDRAPALTRKLAIYKLRSQVSIDDRSPALAAGALLGDQAAAELGLPAEPGRARRQRDVLAYVDPRLATLGVRLLGPATALDALVSTLGAAPADPAEYDAHRLALGVPDGSIDLPPDKALLLESGFDELNGVDWKKGCYMGQELTARTKYRGLVKKRLLPVSVGGAVPVPGTLIAQNGKEVGELRSGRDGRALALLRLEALDSDAPLLADGVAIEASRPPWVRLPERSQAD